MKKVIVIVGPTASGKTTAGIAVAKKLNGAVVSADSRQLYTGMDIGTATPQSLARASASWRTAGQEPHTPLIADVIDGIDHYLLNVASPDIQWSLAQWQAAAFAAINYTLTQQRTPILVGGTMLYLDSIIFNYQIPQVEPNQALRAELEHVPVEELYAKLLVKDPEASTFIESHHKMRIIRALEVMAKTNQPFSHLRQQGPKKYDFQVIGIFPGWDILTQNITTRIHQMWQQGLVAETEKLIKQYGANLSLLKTINYRQAVQHLTEAYSKDQAITEMIRANLRYAHRQMSWWKSRQDITWAKTPNEIQQLL